MEGDFRTLVSDDLVDTLGSLLEHGLDKVSPLRLLCRTIALIDYM